VKEILVVRDVVPFGSVLAVDAVSFAVRCDDDLALRPEGRRLPMSTGIFMPDFGSID
jgi:hypothetical protein